MFNSLKEKSRTVGKPSWRAMLDTLAELHERSVHAPLYPLSFQWEAIATGEGSAMVFGHWDTVHMALDTLEAEPQHSLFQIHNIIDLQQENGFIPGVAWLDDIEFKWSNKTTCPPLWPVVVDDYIQKTDDLSVLKRFLPALEKQINWFEKNRKTSPEGFYYLDCLDRFWESGVEDGARYDLGSDCIEPEDVVCVDTTSHLYLLYSIAACWKDLLKESADHYHKRALEVGRFIQNELFDEESGMFLDKWMIGNPEKRTLSYESFWPLIVGAASKKQAEKVINENILNPKRFFSSHPISTVSKTDINYDYHLWRGPVRNSMTFWVARGCERYGWNKAAHLLLERALDSTSLQFDITGKIWEFYHPDAGSPESLTRNYQGGTPPFVDYLGHNPLIVMASMWDRLK